MFATTETMADESEDGDTGSSIYFVYAIFLAELLFGIVAIWNVETQEHVNRVLKWLFYSNIFFAMVFSFSTIVIQQQIDREVSEYIHLMPYYLSWCSVLTTLVWYVIMSFFHDDITDTHSVSFLSFEQEDSHNIL